MSGRTMDLLIGIASDLILMGQAFVRHLLFLIPRDTNNSNSKPFATRVARPSVTVSYKEGRLSPPPTPLTPCAATEQRLFLSPAVHKDPPSPHLLGPFLPPLSISKRAIACPSLELIPSWLQTQVSFFANA